MSLLPKSWELAWLRWRWSATALQEYRTAEIKILRHEIETAKTVNLDLSDDDMRGLFEIDRHLEADVRMKRLRLLLVRSGELGIPVNLGDMEVEKVQGRLLPTLQALRSLEGEVWREIGERRARRVQWLTALTGVLGTLIGLISILTG